MEAPGRLAVPGVPENMETAGMVRSRAGAVEGLPGESGEPQGLMVNGLLSSGTDGTRYRSTVWSAAE